MIIRLIVVCVFIFYSIAASAAIAPKKVRCELASKMVDAGWDEELAIIGDCYLYGVYYEQDREQARFHYLQAMVAGSHYAQFKVGEDYLFFPQKESEAMLGYYLLDDLARGESNSDKPYAAYLLATFERRIKAFDRSKEYFELSKKDSHFDAAYALAYLEYEANGASKAYKKLVAESLEFQEKIKIPRTISFSCWLDLQEDRDHPFTMDNKVLAKLKELLGQCE